MGQHGGHSAEKIAVDRPSIQPQQSNQTAHRLSLRQDRRHPMAQAILMAGPRPAKAEGGIPSAMDVMKQDKGKIMRRRTPN